MGRGVLGAWLLLAGCITGGGGAQPALLANHAAPVKVERDGDGDGVVDSGDRCPAAAGTGADGCAESDRDGDRVADRGDRCPDTPGEMGDGCPVPDSDGDGFLDPDDRCPDVAETTNGFADADGCADELPADLVAISGVLVGVTFELNKDTLKKSSWTALDGVVAALTKYADVRVQISVHTDDRGESAMRGELSARRAKSVGAYLITKGIDARRVETRGMGAEVPLESNKTAAGRAKNRRIEVAILAR